MVIKDFQISQPQSGPPLVEINIDGIVRHANHPEHLVPVNVHIVVVDLLSNIGRSDRTGIQIKSDKAECGFVMFTVCTNELALTKTHIRLEGERHAGTGRRVGYRAAAADVRQSHVSLKNRYLRRVDDGGQSRGVFAPDVLDEDEVMN